MTWHKTQLPRQMCSSPKIAEQLLATTNDVLTDEQLETSFIIRYIFVRTNVGEWEDFPEGVEFDVGYIDTGRLVNVSQNAPVILGIPSSVGTHEELLETFVTFVRMGYRVVIVNLPGKDRILILPFVGMPYMYVLMECTCIHSNSWVHVQMTLTAAGFYSNFLN